MDPELLFRIVDVTGVFANGLLGAAAARRHRYDLVGYLTLGAASALGGGLLRDMMLGQGFPVALTDPWYLSGAFSAAFIGYFFSFGHKWSRRTLVLADVLALGCWSSTGASKGFAAGLGWIPSIFLGVVTAVCGGIIRDILCHETPAVFGGKPLYATFAFLAAFQMVVWQNFGFYEIGMATAIIFCSICGILARKLNWVLPTRTYDLGAHALQRTRPLVRRPAPHHSRSHRQSSITDSTYPAASPCDSKDAPQI